MTNAARKFKGSVFDDLFCGFICGHLATRIRAIPQVCQLTAPQVAESPNTSSSLVSDSGDDRETLHTYPLPGVVMFACNALLSADPVDLERLS